VSETNFQQWVGRRESVEADLNAFHIAAMSATLDQDHCAAEGSPLPPGWQWLFFNPAVRRSELGADGHPARGGFLPPVELPRRMWAGSRLRYLESLPVGARAERSSQILSVVNKTGKRGALCFVTVEHTIRCGGVDCIVEEQDIVYKEATPPGTPAPAPERFEAEASWRQRVDPDTTLLFRFSALTFNGHRIHYDLNYARDVEGYPGLVVHGPLTAILLQGFACSQAGNRPLLAFDFKGVNPLFVNSPFDLEGRWESPDVMDLWARGPAGELAMKATARFR